MKFKSGNELMNLPNYIKFGLEIEVQNVDINKLKQLFKMYPELDGWKITTDPSVTDNGVELVSSPLSEKDPDVYKKLEMALELLKKCPADKNRDVYVNEQCGGHIHYDATMMRKNPEMAESFLRLLAESEEIRAKMCTAKGDPIRMGAVKQTPTDGIRRVLFSGISESIKAVDRAKDDINPIFLKDNAIKLCWDDMKKRNNMEKPEDFLKILANSEEMKKIVLAGMYEVNRMAQSTISNIRRLDQELPEVIKQIPKKTITGAASSIESIIIPQGYAHPMGEKIQKAAQKGDLVKGVKSTSKGNIYRFDKSLKKLACHETMVNFQHISSNRGIMGVLYALQRGKRINTYECRDHNSTIDLDEIKKNIMLDSAFSKIAYEMAYESGKNDKKLSAFFEKDISEEEKVDRFLDLMFENEDDKNVFKERWKANKDAKVFKEAKGFARTFKKSEVKDYSLNTNLRTAYNTMKRVLGQAKDFIKDEASEIGMENIIMDYGGRNE